ncbi:sensor histidine kinase [Streptomyces albipurpureus]|uniref:histidine kinase n=1 Tax=Streptomyces albipurpureus TaxID=2897419 RepID=A0ABT0UYH3_9ACTN|nr:ATP-binding protein [Streptomyces sp. CWNU-1]MCM2393618.1 ATP-binding protein [Streptomyces sp. CWNU-1]
MHHDPIALLATGPFILAALVAVWVGCLLVRSRRQAARLEDELASGERVLASVVAQGLSATAAQITRAVHPPLSEGLRDTAFAGHLHTLARQHLNAVEGARAEGAAQAAAGGSTEVIACVAPRLHALATRALGVLDQLENDTEDPDRLQALFRVDHATTLTRRYTESLMVVGKHGFPPSREPVLLPTVLRQAVAETEQYSRARIVGWLRETIIIPAHAGPAVIHLLTQLIDNALRFSREPVSMRTTWVANGLAIEVEDRGLHMSAQTLDWANHLLSRPDQVDVRQQLADGRIGLLVTALLAAEYGIHVELRQNVFGGTTALVVLPHELAVVTEEASALAAGASADAGDAVEPQGAVAQPSGMRARETGSVPVSSPPVSASVQPPAGVLPQRRRPTPPGGRMTDSGDVPELPRRERTRATSRAVSPTPDADSPAVEGPLPAFDLMAQFTAGLHRPDQHPGDVTH